MPSGPSPSKFQTVAASLPPVANNVPLLLNDNAEFDAKPELEIYADDVKCSHGSTSGSIDLNSIHYLKSRGIPEKEAYQMLINGFLSEILEKLPEDNLKKFLIEKIGRQINGY